MSWFSTTPALVDKVNFATRLQLVLLPLWLALWDVFIVAVGASTISSMVAYEGRRTASIPLAWGILSGHFFALWTKRPYSSSSRTWVWILAVVLFAVWDVWVAKYGAGKVQMALRYPFLVMLLGTALGFFCWGQNGNR